MNIRWHILLLSILCASVTATTDDVNKSMIAIMPAQARQENVNLLPSVELRAGDWVAAWQTARDSCPTPREVRIFLKERPGAGANEPVAYECLDIKARGQVLVINVRKIDKSGEAVIIVPATEVLRIEIAQKPAS